MAKRIIQQARGHGSLTYQVRSKAYRYTIGYPGLEMKGKAQVIKLLNSPAHYAPLAKLKIQNKIFFIPAFNGMIEGQEISLGDAKNSGDIAQLKDIAPGTSIYNIEIYPGDGGKMIRSSGSSATITKKEASYVSVLLPSKKEINFNPESRATIGIIAGAGRLDKPFVKAGNMHYKMKARNKLWPRSSAVKMNVNDHPFGSGRGKRIKSKIAKRNSPPGANVGHLRPSRTGRKKK